MIYADLGAFNGDTVEQFINWGQLLGDITDCKIYAFEPNPNFQAEWDSVVERQSQHVREINFIQKAAWTDDKGLKLSIYQDPTGSSVMEAKRWYGKGSFRDVESFDFSQWLMQFKGLGEKIYVKFDIEGAEYPILKKMIADGTDKLCTLLFIEWHGRKMHGDYVEQQKFIEANLKCRWEEWR